MDRWGKPISVNTLRTMLQLGWCLNRMCLAENCQKQFLQPFVELQTFVFHNLAVQMRLKNAIGRGKDSQLRHTWYDAPGLYKAGPRLVVVTRRLRRYFAFARGPKGVRLQGEVMKTVSRVAKVFSRGRNHMKHLVEANLQSRAFWAKRWTRPSIHVLLQHSFSPFHFCRLLLRHLWEKPWGPHCLHKKPREPPSDCEETWRNSFQRTCCEHASAWVVPLRDAPCRRLPEADSSAVRRTSDLCFSQLGIDATSEAFGGFCRLPLATSFGRSWFESVCFISSMLDWRNRADHIVYIENL